MIELVKEVKEGEIVTEKYLTPVFIPFSVAVGNGIKEKNLTLRIGKRIRDILTEYEKVSVKMSRTGDTFLSLSARTKAANEWGADIFFHRLLKMLLNRHL
jgi:hypothetical protein